MRKALTALALVFFAAHAACLPTSFADIDAINFAMGVQDFDVALHQPHPPGYPVFIAMGKASTAVLGAAGVPAAEVRGLAVWSAVCGALLIPLMFHLFRAVVPDGRIALAGAVITAVSPLFWFNALRPLSDLAGLAAVVGSQVLIVRVVMRRNPPHAGKDLIVGAVLAGLAIGIRSQSFVLTLPLLALALVLPRTGLRASSRLGAIAALAAGALLWAIPMVIAAGGLQAYLNALADQAGEDFAGVAMLWTTRTPRAALAAATYTFLWPWGNVPAGVIVVSLAGFGAVRMFRREPFALAVLLVAFVPYAVFHLLFQETVTTRYALPLLPPVGFLGAVGVAAAGFRPLAAASTLFALFALALALPAAATYARHETPPTRALREAAALPAATVIAMHAGMLRQEQWYHRNASGRAMRSPHGREVPALVQRWGREPELTAAFLANPRRTDLAMLDPRSRELIREYEWGFPEMPFVGGVRPGARQLYLLRPPGWMLGDGWALTAEIGGQTARLGAGPHRRPAVAWIRSRETDATLLVGGRNLRDDVPARLSVRLAGRMLDAWDVPPGFFFRTVPLPARVLSSADAYVLLQVEAAKIDAPDPGVSLEQFDVQTEGVPMAGLVSGWEEPEYNPATGRSWRWMAPRATLWVRPGVSDVVVTLEAESPLRYYDESPVLRASVAGEEIARLSPSGDFRWDVRVPARLLRTGEPVVLESDQSFVAGNGDQRTLALRVYSIGIK